MAKSFTIGMNLDPEADRELLNQLNALRSELDTGGGLLSWSALLRHIVYAYLNPPEVPPVALSQNAPGIDYDRFADAIAQGIIRAGGVTITAPTPNAQPGKPAALPEGREDPNDPLVGRLLGHNFDRAFGN